jgi:hypothetical protein
MIIGAHKHNHKRRGFYLYITIHIPSYRQAPRRCRSAVSIKTNMLDNARQSINYKVSVLLFFPFPSLSQTRQCVWYKKADPPSFLKFNTSGTAESLPSPDQTVIALFGGMLSKPGRDVLAWFGYAMRCELREENKKNKKKRTATRI